MLLTALMERMFEADELLLLRRQRSCKGPRAAALYWRYVVEGQWNSPEIIGTSLVYLLSVQWNSNALVE
jgi:hypothetical protein